MNSLLTQFTSKPLRIWLIHHGEPLPSADTGPMFRSHKLAQTLATQGHSVKYWCSTFLHHKKQLYTNKSCTLDVNGYTIRMLHAGSYRTNHSPARFFHHMRMAKLFASEASSSKDKPDIIICSLPIHHCAFQAVRYAKQKNIPVVIDIRDYWPDNILLAFPHILRWLARIALSYDFAITKYALSNATAIVSMMEHLLQWGLTKFTNRGRMAGDRVFLLGGAPQQTPTRSQFYSNFPQIPKERLESTTVVNYVGTFTHLTHPMVVIEAAKILAEQGSGDKFTFLIAGTGDYLERCSNMAKGLANVFFLGWLDPQSVSQMNSVTNIGVIPSYEEYSFPNKTFAYLGGGLPVACSDKGELRSLIESYNAGFYFDIHDPTSLAQKLLWWNSQNKETQTSMAQNAKHLFTEKLDANKIYSDYANYIETLAENHINHKANTIA